MNDKFYSSEKDNSSALSTVDYLTSRAERADFKEFERIMALIPDVTPDSGDELP